MYKQQTRYTITFFEPLINTQNKHWGNKQWQQEQDLWEKMSGLFASTATQFIHSNTNVATIQHEKNQIQR